jgi:uncharacterized protein YtpQ (UPF0354 family)
MNLTFQNALRAGAAITAFSLFLCGAQAQSVALPQDSEAINQMKDNLMVVLRESQGANRLEDLFSPVGKMTATLPNGKTQEFELAHWEYIGDMHVRFVFDSPQTMVNASMEDMQALGLSRIEDALPLALKNIKRVYGDPAVFPWEEGIMLVQGRSPDLDSSYFIDREFWHQLEKKHPEGLVAAVPMRSGLLFAPLADKKAVQILKDEIVSLYDSGEQHKVSSALYLFKNGKWSVFQAAIK